MAYADKYYMLRGDPGLFSGLKRFAGKVAGIAGRVPLLGKVARIIPGVSTVAGIAGLAGAGLKAVKGMRTAGGGFSQMMTKQQMAGRGIKIPGALPTIAAGGAGLGTGLALGPGGFGSMQRALQSGRAAVDPMTGRIVRTGRRYRRMHYTNMRALNRSIRRVKGFAKIARSALVVSQRVRVKKRARGKS